MISEIKSILIGIFNLILNVQLFWLVIAHFQKLMNTVAGLKF
jgi:hypothetical protein